MKSLGKTESFLILKHIVCLLYFKRQFTCHNISTVNTIIMLKYCDIVNSLSFFRNVQLEKVGVLRGVLVGVEVMIISFFTAGV